MPKTVIELRYQRIPKEFVYDGSILLYRDDVPGNSRFDKFERKDLQDVAVALHHLVRFVSFSGDEFCVRFEQRAPGATRRPVTNELTPQQVNLLFESVESARAFLAPVHMTREIKHGQAENH